MIKRIKLNNCVSFYIYVYIYMFVAEKGKVRERGRRITSSEQCMWIRSFGIRRE